MNANEMSYEFDVIYDKVASAESPGYTDKEKSIFLSKAQEILTKRYQPAEFTERRRRDFANITKTVDITSASTTQDTGKPNGTRYDLPTDFMYAESEEATITSSNSCFNNTRIPVDVKREAEYTTQIKNPFKKPMVNGGIHDCAWRMDYNDNTNGIKRVDLITDGTFSIGTYHLTYAKKPVDIVPFTGDNTTTAQVDCELNDTIHRELVEVAVRIASGVTTPQEYQIKLNEEKINN
jgi:hypothetical protein